MTAPAATTIRAERAAPVDPARLPTRVKISSGMLAIVGVIIIWLIARIVWAGQWTLPLDKADLTPFQLKLNDLNNWVGDNRNTSPIFLYFFNEIRQVVDTVGTFFTHLFAHTDDGLEIPEIGWLGTVVLVTFVAYALGNVKVAGLTLAVFLIFGLQGLWPEAMDTFALVISAVLFSLIFGIPLGIWAGTSKRFNAFITPVLDFMQIMPSFAYLAPLVLIFLIGPASAIIATIIFAIPPVIRITAHGIRQVPQTTREAVDSLGVARSQRLRHVLLPMSKRTTVIGINQTIMAALSMVTIASLIGAPGLGLSVSQALQSLDVGTAFNAGVAIVLMAICFDRVVTAASVRTEVAVRAGKNQRRQRWVILAVGLVVTLVAIYLSRTYLWAAQAPANWPDLGTVLTNLGDSVSSWMQTNLSLITEGFKNVVTYGLLNPLESLLTGTPFFIIWLVLVVIAFVAGGWKTAITVLVGCVLMVGLGVWSDSMSTLAATLLATVAVVLLGLVFGVWMGRSKAADRGLRPLLDAAQTMPAFVYLVPFLALFGASRFTAIVAAVVYAAPAAIKIIADGISQVPATTVEAAMSTGSTRWQMITKVQLPMSAKSIGLATNQGLIYALSMVVIGGMVGAGALGYDVVAGLAQDNLFGKGLAAGLTLVVMGVILDRITQAAAAHSGVRSRSASTAAATPAPATAAALT